MLKLNAGLSRKIGLPNYGSRGAMVNVEIELPADVLKDSDKLRRQVRGCFETLRAAVDEELGVTPEPHNEVEEQRWRPTADPRRNGGDNGHARNGTNDNGYAGNGRGGLPCTEKQVRALHAFSRRAGADLAAELRRLGVTTAEDLSRRQASEAIDRFKEKAEA
ncbi:hypothetical protein [Alienimonas californiensis]|uniref:Uncharacterized protein n=1 Tax=Alienimonas californiensis TaxID=2527989 RepID=A0A517PBL8_9PLAN|nr:hypothetical protein [Alienimonas californiensis]QDT16773.1 hypothetical protein CA12_28800 [Alienimonas californiensis]